MFRGSLGSGRGRYGAAQGAGLRKSAVLGRGPASVSGSTPWSARCSGPGR